MSADEEDDFAVYRKRAQAVARLFRRRPHNIIEEIEKLGFAYYADDGEDAEEIAEERAAKSVTNDQTALVAYFEGSALPDDGLLALWRVEIGKPDAPFALWRRYFRAGNPQLRKLLLFGLDQTPSDRDLLSHLAFLHEFASVPRELLARYTLACDRESDPRRFATLARDFDEVADSFGYDTLMALKERYETDAIKKRVLETLLTAKKNGDEAISF
jgi:hypothetical protein